MELSVTNIHNKEKATSIEASDMLFNRPYHEDLVHQVVSAFLANARSGNRAQLTRAQVQHTTKKPWRQKGTGRARAGMSSSPLWRGGGRAFPNSSLENFSHKVNRKMYRAGMAAILSQLLRDGRLQIIDELVVASAKTKDFVVLINGMGIVEETLLITKAMDENLYLSSRNLPHVLVIDAVYADPYSLLRFKKIIVTLDAIKYFEEQWL